MAMEHIGYSRACRRKWRRTKGFRLGSGRLFVHRLRIRFIDFMRLLNRWKSTYVRALLSLKNGMGCAGGRAAETPLCTRQDYKLRSYGRSNTFYAEAIAECLEFIKRSSNVSADEGAALTTR